MTEAGGATTSQLAGFRARCEALAGRSLTDQADLHDFSVSRAEDFWGAFLDWADLPLSGSPAPAIVGEDVETARFFPGVSLNYAEVLLRPLPGVPDDAPAVSAVHHDRPTDRRTRGELRADVTRAATALAGLGLAPGDRVSVVATNALGLVTGVLAAAAVGATVSTAAPDMGSPALLGRLAQTTPALLLLDRAGMDEASVAGLIEGLPTLRAVCLLDEGPLPTGLPAVVHQWADLVAGATGPDVPWPRLPFDHPLFVMFSSGTTGPPKAIVHGAGGTLLEHLKEHRLHGDLRPEDTLYFHTTAAWMMWNWQLSALAVGAGIVVNDGPVLGPGSLWSVVDDERVTVFGTSPAYLQLCQDAGHRPARAHDLGRLRSVLSTGAVLHEWQFTWVAEQLGAVPLQSISGGTDIIGCFLLGHPELPVVPGRTQSRSLGLDVAAFDEHGRAVVDRVGELVCRRPFPSRPVGFLRDPGGERFHRAYFADNPGVWTHGDLVELHDDGSARVLGRSDGVMNVNGIRIGPAEVYTALHGLTAVSTAMAVEQRDPGHPGQTRMVLLVVPADGTRVDAALEQEIRRTLRQRASAAHVPALVLAVPELPTTHSGKPSERAARDTVNGDPVVNTAALRNPASLAAIRAALDGQPVEQSPAAPLAAAHDPVLPARRDPVPTSAGGLTVRQLWTEVLATEDAGLEDDFFDLGGDSRQLMTLVHRVRTETGVELPTVDFFRHPTLGTLVRAVDAQAVGPVTVDQVAPGTGTPVFLVALPWSAAADRRAALDLVAGTAVDRPALHTVVPDLLAARRDPGHDVLDSLVRAVVDDVCSVRPEGPYRLAGLAEASALALDVAAALTAGGAVVEGVALVAAEPPPALGARSTARLRGWRRTWQAVRSPERATLLWALFVDRHAPATTPPDHQARLEVLAALDRHVPATHSGPVDLLGGAAGPVRPRTRAAWRRVAPGATVAASGLEGPAV